MKRRSAGLLGVMALGLLAGFNHSASAEVHYCDLPAGPVPFITEDGESSYAPVTFSQLPPGFTVTNGTYLGWCAQYQVVILKEVEYEGVLYESLAPLPGHLQSEPWDKINYILNHKQGTVQDIQNAIWFIIAGRNETLISLTAKEMINDASLFGSGFVPTNGQVQAVILDPLQPVQRIVIEVVCDDTKSPTTSISSPASTATFTSAQTVSITASATDNVSVTKVEFYDGLDLKGTQTTPPYILNWPVTPDENGAHDWTVRAYDAVGHSTTSSIVTLQVNIDTLAPSVSIVRPTPQSTFGTAQSVTIEAAASDNRGITRVEFYDGPILMGARTNPPYTLEWAVTAEDNGAHEWTAKAFDMAGNSTVSDGVSLNVLIDAAPPAVSITSPSPQTYTTARTVTIAAAATDNFGVTKVEFYDGLVLKGTRTTAPYIYDWPFTAAENGPHQWTAKAYDAAGHSTVSSAVNLTVDIDIVPPQVAIVSPASDTSYTSARTVLITATASDNVGVTKVEFYDGAVLKATRTSAPYACEWSFTPNDNGTHPWSAKAYDTAGHSTVSTVMNLSVDIDVVAPQVSIVSPASGTTYTTAQTVTITASVSDNAGVSKVEFYEGGLLKGTKTMVPYTYDWSFTGTDNGLHEFSAKAYDAGGNNSISSKINLTVDIDVVPPDVSIVSPVSGTTYTTAQTVTIAAIASDNLGVTRVEFYDGATLKATKTTAPFSYDWSFTAADNAVHVWTAKAYDQAGHSTVSTMVNLSVDIDVVAPQVSIVSPASGTTYTTAQTVTITASVSDNAGVSKVEFYDGLVLKATRTTAPYIYDWPFTAAENGVHVWTTKAYDAAGHSTVSSAVNLTVDIDIVPPQVAIVSPASDTSYTSARTVLITATASDNVGVTKVEFYDGAVLKATRTSAPYACEWSFTPNDNGTHPWSAKAYDAAGQSPISTVVNLSVDIDVVAPQVSIVSPASGTTYTTAQTVTITASVSDNAGVSKVEFYEGGLLKGTKTLGPYTYDWSFTGTDNGLHEFSAKAYDAGGNNSISSKINLTVDIDVVPPEVSIVSPVSGTTYTTAQTVTIAAIASDNLSVTKVEFYDGATLKATKTAAPYSYDWSFTHVDDGLHQWVAKTYDATGNSAVSSVVSLTVDIDTVGPHVVITSPSPGSLLTNQLVRIEGTASDDIEVAGVEYQLNGGPFEMADGTTNWSAQLGLSAGDYTLRVRSTDRSGNRSGLASHTFACFLTCPLRVTMSGEGSITPNLDGMHLDLDKSYTLTAAPGLGYVFSNWTGGLTAGIPQLTFVMKSNLILQANFLSSPFKPMKGTYSGLFYETTGVLHESSGAFTITTTAGGTFTGRLQLAGKRYAWSGRFDAESKSTNSIARKGTTPLVVALHLVSVNGLDRIMGKITNGDWKAELLGDRAVFQARTNPAPYAGKYTLVVPGSADASSPAGDGAGAATVNAGGQVRLTGRLADGTTISQSAPLSGSGQWPLYLSLYGGKGSLLSWVTFTNRTEDDLNGLTSWIKPSLPKAKYYPIGFTNEALLVGSIYTTPVGVTNRVLNFTNGIVWLSGGNLAEPSTNSVTLNAPNKVITLSSNKLTLAIVSSSGLFTGSFKDPNSGKTLPLRGALLQKQNAGSGYFLGTNQSGHVRFEEAP